jgi:hypothetical protein
MLIKGYINRVCRETPIDFRMGVPAPTTNFASHELTLTETHRKVAMNAPCQSRQDARKLEYKLEMRPQRFVMLCANANTYNVVVWATYHFFDPCTGGGLTASIMLLFMTCSTLW